MWLNAQHVGNLLVRQAFEHRQAEDLSVALRQLVYHSHHLAQRHTPHVSFLVLGGNQLRLARLFERNRWQCLQMSLAFRCHVPRNGRHPCLCPPDIAQTVERSEDNHESVVQHVLHCLLVADIASAHAPHLPGVCLVQFSEGIRIPLSAPFYQPCYLHRKHNVSIY